MTNPPRREFLKLGTLSLGAFAIATYAHPQVKLLSLTPSCDSPSLTPPQTPGPFYTPNSPQRRSLLEPRFSGTKLILTGVILTPNCQVIANALIDFWHADHQGNYDNRGFTFRGHQFTDDQGRYTLETIIPGRYATRTPHIHVKIQTPSQQLLTTQLYFPHQPSNRRDGLFNPNLIMQLQNQGNLQQGKFDFVLPS